MQAGLGFTLDWDSDFIGRDALLPQKGQPVNKRLLHFSLTAGEEAPLMFGEEPIYRDGVLVGGVTSGGVRTPNQAINGFGLCPPRRKG